MSDLITRPWPFPLMSLAAGRFVHLYQDPYDALAPNPVSRSRFALPGSTPGSPNTRGAYFVAESATGGIWEVLLRQVAPHGRKVHVAPGVLAGWHLAELELLEDIPDILRLDRPHRLRFVDAGSLGDEIWHNLCGTAIHALTHGAAHEVNRFFAGHGLTHAGLGWHSRQWPDDVVHVLYDPPFDGSQWRLIRSIALDSASGLDLVRQAVTNGGYEWDLAPGDAPVDGEAPGL